MPEQPGCGWEGAPCRDPVLQQRLIGVRMLLQALGVLTSAAFATIGVALFVDQSAVMDFWSGCHWFSEGVICLFVAAVCLALETRSFFYAVVSQSLLSHASHRLLLAILYLWLGAYSVGGRIQQASEVWRTFGKVTGVVAWVVAVGDVSISSCYVEKNDLEPEVTEHVTVPASAVGAVWGPQTSTKLRLERDHGVQLQVPAGASSEATVVVSGTRSATRKATAEIHELVKAASDRQARPDALAESTGSPGFSPSGALADKGTPASRQRSDTCEARLALGRLLPSLPEAEEDPATAAAARATPQAGLEPEGPSAGLLVAGPPPAEEPAEPSRASRRERQERQEPPRRERQAERAPGCAVPLGCFGPLGGLP